MIFGLWNFGMTMKKYGTYIDIFFTDSTLMNNINHDLPDFVHLRCHKKCCCLS